MFFSSFAPLWQLFFFSKEENFANILGKVTRSWLMMDRGPGPQNAEQHWQKTEEQKEGDKSQSQGKIKEEWTFARRILDLTVQYIDHYSLLLRRRTIFYVHIWLFIESGHFTVIDIFFRNIQLNIHFHIKWNKCINAIHNTASGGLYNR